MRLTPVLAASALTLASLVSAQEPSPTLLLRQPTISAAHIAFAYANNIWIVDRAGGVARRLTSFQGATSDPRLSPDGQWVAFSSSNGGNADVYVLPIAGGEPRRLTWHPGADLTTGWTPDSKRIVFTSARASDAPGGAFRFWTVGVDGGPETAMPIPRAFQGHISPDGKYLAYRLNNSWDDERRNYRGGQNKPIWIVDLATYDLTTVPHAGSKDIDPVWMGGAVYFLSDRDGVQNIWRYDLASKQVAQVTRYTDFDVKTVESGGGALVFEQAGRLHVLDPSSNATPKAVPIVAAGDFPWAAPQWKDVGARITSLALSPTGKRAVVEARGEIFTIPAEKGDWKNLTRSSGTADRNPTWSPDGKTIAYFSDASGEYALVLASPDGTTPARTIAWPDATFPYTPAWSPDSRKLAWHDAKLRIFVADVTTGRVTHVDTDPWMVPERTVRPVWSPDSRWLAYAKHLNSLYHAIYVTEVETGKVTQLTDGLADAWWPVWDQGGKHLWFLASTNYALRTGWLDMTNYERPRESALYVAVLRKGDPTPFPPESDDEGAIPTALPSAPPIAVGPPRAANGAPITGDSVKPVRQAVTIDFDGIAQRILAVPGVAPRDYAQLTAGAAGTVFFWENAPETGTAERTAPGGPIHRYVLRERKATVVAPSAVQFTVSADGKKLLYRTGGAQGALFLLDAAGPPTATATRLNSALRMYLEPQAEWAQIVEETRRKVRDYLYVPNFHGADWTKVMAMYKRFVPHVRHRADLTYLLDQMTGELAVGHSYVNGGDFPEVPPTTTGLLGADFAIENGAYRITRVLTGESWNPDVRAPLAAPGVDVRAGEYVLAIDGVPLSGRDNIYRLLDGTANRQVVLTLNGTPSMAGARRVTVVPVANEGLLRNRAWVERNRRMVDSLSGGKLAYVHLPNTGQGGYTNFNRYYFAQQDRQGAVIDERYNGGGSAADYIIELLSRDFDGYFNNPVGDRVPFTSPGAGIWGPKVMIINEMAGSGGDLMPFMFKRRKIGPLIGTRTWGGLVATSDQPPFVDGGGLVAPRIGFFNRDNQWDVENVGVAADIEVENTPKEMIAGRDPQLERAVAEAMRLLRERPSPRVMKEPAPPVWGRRPLP
ncbi:MAG: PDZ domain-containing protein [Gemmatimonadaceae bacterium]|nr:PDZ domain-containing protein [Gemmatimonadaceae bacterium]